MTIPLWLSIGFTIFFATTTLRMAGFGAALVAMPIFTPLLGIVTAAPLMTSFSFTNFSLTMMQFWRRLTLRDVWRLTLASLLFIPVGVLSINYISETILRFLLGLSCVVFAVYRLIKLPLPALKNPRWAYLFGCLSGLLGGAVNVNGVPVVIYAETQGWEIERYRINLFSFFFASSVVSVISRFAAGQFTRQIGLQWLQALPFLLAGNLIGNYLTRFVDRKRFGKLVLGLILVMGVRTIMVAVA